MTEKPICGYCGLTEDWHQPSDHPFDAVGGSLGRIDPRFGMPADMPPRQKLMLGSGLSVAAWAAMILAICAAVRFIRF